MAVRVLDRRREAHPPQTGAHRLQPAQREHQLIAALAFGEGVNFIHHHTLQPAKRAMGILVRGQQRQAFRRGQQDMRRIGALAFLAAGGEVSPVRSSIRMGRPISSTGVRRLRLMSAASALSGEM